MITNLKRLSNALDKAAPAAPTAESVVKAIEAQSERIQGEIKRAGTAYVKVNGLQVKLSPSD